MTRRGSTAVGDSTKLIRSILFIYVVLLAVDLVVY